MSNTSPVSQTLCQRIAVVCSDSPPVNALSLPVRQGLDQCLRAAMEDDAVDAIVVICRGRTFFAGADIRELGAPPVSPKISELNALVEDSPKPVVAAMHGTVLGGGLELALSCHYRIALPSTQCGLTEVTLGILPGAGGTQRLPRVVGVPRALQMITSGERVGARECRSIGLVDRLTEGESLQDEAVVFAREIVDNNLPLVRVRDRDEKLAEARDNEQVFAQFRQQNARKFRGFNAPERCIRCVEAAVTLPFEEGLRFEKEMLAELIALGQPAALQYAFFAERQIRKIPGLPSDSQPLPIEKIAVIGAGTMGGGIAMNFVNIGLPVTLVETSQGALDRGLEMIRRNFERSVQRGKLTADQVDERMGRLTGTLDYGDLADCDLVIEAVFEDLSVKQAVFEKLDAVVRDDAILATNTSFLDIRAIGSVTQRPGRVLGMHFFSPANVMKLLEVVRTPDTDSAVIATVLELGRRIGKLPVLVGNGYGFVGNRIVVQRKEQGQALLLEGAMPWQVDRVLTDFGFPMGPFAMSDLAGLDIGWTAEQSRGETLRDLLCEMGRRGQKTGAGYYDYDDRRKASPSALVEKTIRDFVAQKGLETRAISDEEILHRCLYPMINEACRVLEEGIAIRASDIDVIMLNGYGFPRYRGGLMFYADQIGLDHVLEVVNKLHRQLGDTMQPAALLETLAAEGGRLSQFANT
ncbi:MAG: 3-hydroxyacyl-CoA dehydrogenase [Porticoccaceae bacterium]|nr:3-hydroxyacyl-CoA dehydrogenase [Porticoccaceae bacterium]